MVRFGRHFERIRIAHPTIFSGIDPGAKIMKHPQDALRALFAGLMVFCLSFSLLISPNTANAQAVPNPAPANETIHAGAYVIPMDNNYQGRGLDNDCSNTAFNLKAYGLAVRLLHNNIPLKWIISATKSNKDNT